MFAVRVSPGGPTAAPDAPPASDKAPATPNTVTAFARLLRFEARFACDMVETSHINSDGVARANQIVPNQPRLRLRGGQFILDSPGRREAALGISVRPGLPRGF